MPAGVAGVSNGTSQRYIFALGTIATGRCATVRRFQGAPANGGRGEPRLAPRVSGAAAAPLRNVFEDGLGRRRRPRAIGSQRDPLAILAGMPTHADDRFGGSKQPSSFDRIHVSETTSVVSAADDGHGEDGRVGGSAGNRAAGGNVGGLARGARRDSISGRFVEWFRWLLEWRCHDCFRVFVSESFRAFAADTGNVVCRSQVVAHSMFEPPNGVSWSLTASQWWSPSVVTPSGFCSSELFG